MKPSDFDEGDGLYTPRICGYEVLYDTICDEMESCPEDYEKDIIALFNDSHKFCWKKIQDYIDEWCVSRSESAFL